MGRQVRKITVFSFFGKLALAKSVTLNEENNTIALIELGTLPSGVYSKNCWSRKQFLKISNETIKYIFNF